MHCENEVMPTIAMLRNEYRKIFTKFECISKKKKKRKNVKRSSRHWRLIHVECEGFGILDLYSIIDEGLKL